MTVKGEYELNADGSSASLGKALIVSPQAGMCNRFRAICAGVLLARLSGRSFYHCWMEEPAHENDISIVRQMRESTWTTFFAEDPGIPFLNIDEASRIDQVFSEWGPGEYWYPMQSSAIRRCGWSGAVQVERTSADPILESKAEKILLETSLCLKPSFMTENEFESALAEIYLSHFKPQPVLLDAVEKSCEKEPYVGVHIRRADHLKHVRDADIKRENWAKIILEQVGVDQSVYLCSDDRPFAESVARLLTGYRLLSVSSVHHNDQKIQAFLEFLRLSGATRIYGTVGSSFSREAAIFGNCEFVLCAAQYPKNIWQKLLFRTGVRQQKVECRFRQTAAGTPERGAVQPLSLDKTV